MYLERLEIQGFKSFAHKVVLEFPAKALGLKKGITAIVGPNGSGKSNVADAMRWVLGEQSLKVLRGKKSEDVIFAGSDKKARLGYAEVSLFLNNEDGEAPVDYSQVVITRRLYRNGESDYLLNKKKTKLQDILILLAKCKFGQRSYSIIGQGMVDNFLFSPPSERKEFFEEAAGIREFQIKKDSAVNKFKSTREHLEQTEMLLQEIEPRVRSLTRQVKRLEKREEIESQLRELQEKYYGSLWQDNNRRLANLKKDFSEAEEKRKDNAQELEIIKKKLEALEKDNRRGQMFNELQGQYQKILEEKSALREKELILKNKIQFHQPKQTLVNLPSEQMLKELDNLDRQQLSIIEKLGKVKSLDELKAIKEDVVKLNHELGLLKKKLKPQASDDENLKKDKEELAKITKQYEAINDQLAETQKKIKEFNESEENKRGELFGLQKDFQEKLNTLNHFTNQANEIKVGLARVETRVEDLTREMKEELPVELIEEIRKDKARALLKENLLPEIQKLKRQLELIGGIDPEAAKEYEETKTRYDFLKEQSDDLSKSLHSLEQAVDDLQEMIKSHFDQSFNKINSLFEQYFVMLFGGGKAALVKLFEEAKEKKGKKNDSDEEEDDDEIETETVEDAKGKKGEVTLAGIDIQATPPGKKIKNINMLSGGERAMTSIALICAIIANNPSPFVVLDEVDASLDEANSLKFSEILDKLSEKSQFVVITHNRATMHKAGVLYGVTMTDEGTSKLLSIKLSEAEETIKNKVSIK